MTKTDGDGLMKPSLNIPSFDDILIILYAGKWTVLPVWSCKQNFLGQKTVADSVRWVRSKGYRALFKHWSVLRKW